MPIADIARRRATPHLAPGCLRDWLEVKQLPVSVEIGFETRIEPEVGEPLFPENRQFDCGTEYGDDISPIPSAYLNNEPLPDYRHNRRSHDCGLNGLALPMARCLIIDRRSAPRQVDRQNPIFEPN